MCFYCAQSNPSDPTASLNQHLTAQSAMISAANFNDPVWAGQGLVIEDADAAASISTTYTLEVGQSASGRISIAGDNDYFAIQLVAGHIYDFRMLGAGVNYISDTYLTLFDSAGGVVTSDDDGFTSGSNTHEINSSISPFVAGYTGTYFLAAQGYSTNTGDYLLSATEHSTQGVVFTVDEIAWQLTNNGQAFFGDAEAASFNVGADNSLTVNLTALTAEGQFLAHEALQTWSLSTGISFQEVSGAAEITFDDSDLGANAYANTIISGTTITSASVMISTGWLSQFGTTLDSYSFETYIHEIGHALGLAHGGNYNGSASYGFDNYYVNDSIAWSVMSYMQAENDEFAAGGDWNTFVDASFRYVMTPQIADIIAIQSLYGPYEDALTGNTVYGFGSNTGIASIDAAVNSGALMAMTVYDNGGVDTLNFNATSADQVISLAAESLSSVLGGRDNLGIARNVVIENAVGGSGNDSLIGNAADNRLTGNSGQDTLLGGSGQDLMYGGSGNDSLFGGTGNDSLNAGAGNDRIDGGSGSDRAYFLGSAAITVDLNLNTAQNTGQGVDTILSVEYITSGTGNDRLTGTGLANSFVADLGNDTLYGGGGNDALYGGGGNDVINGGSGNDRIDGGAGIDRAYFTGIVAVTVDLNLTTAQNTGLGMDTILGIEHVTSGTGNDRLIGNNADNSFVASDGNDTLYGGNGNDALYGGNGNDSLIGGAGNDRLDGGAGTDRAYFTGSAAITVNLALTTAQNTGQGIDTILNVEHVTSGNGNDSLTGNSAGNSLVSGLGNDTLNGGGGNDALEGGAGNDRLTGGSGADSFVFNTALGAGNIDTITDFTVVDDTIRIENAFFTGLAAGGLAASAFASNLTGLATDALDRIIYETDTGSLYFDADGTGLGARIQFATLQANLALTNADFLVI